MVNSMENNNNSVQVLTVLFGSLYALSFQQWISLLVVLTGVISMLINWYYKQQSLKIQKAALNKTLKTEKPMGDSNEQRKK